MSDDRKQIKRALISVYDKTGLEDLARSLAVYYTHLTLPTIYSV